ncbi:lytic transglycosylase domain-containing protein, partial [Candidatus Gracilibacteria bacterium]|nr:lytic transglycosylase domain-containing protein [Candidatus Gracilibacteria bacterium]
MLENLNEALQAIDEQIKDDEVVTPDEIEEYLDKNPDSEVAKKAKKSLENLNNEISVKVETLKQRIIFDSVQLKEGFSDKKELMWSNAMKVGVNPVAFAMLLNGETNGDTKAGSKTGAVGLGQFTQGAIDEVNSSGVLGFNNLDKKGLLNLSENQQIYLSAWFLKEKYNRVSKNGGDWSDAVVSYNIG